MLRVALIEESVTWPTFSDLIKKFVDTSQEILELCGFVRHTVEHLGTEERTRAGHVIMSTVQHFSCQFADHVPVRVYCGMQSTSNTTKCVNPTHRIRH